MQVDQIRLLAEVASPLPEDVLALRIRRVIGASSFQQEEHSRQEPTHPGQCCRTNHPSLLTFLCASGMSNAAPFSKQRIFAVVNFLYPIMF